MARLVQRGVLALSATVLVVLSQYIDAETLDGSCVEEAAEGGGVELQCNVAMTAAWIAETHLMPGEIGAEILCIGGDKGYDHVDFKTDSGDTNGGDMGDRHVDFSVEDSSESSIDRGNGHIDFRIAIDPDGRVEVNGEELAVCDPADGCRISLAWSGDTGALVVQVVGADGALVAAQYALAEAPTELQVEAAEVCWLSVTPQ